MEIEEIVFFYVHSCQELQVISEFTVIETAALENYFRSHNLGVFSAVERRKA